MNYLGTLNDMYTMYICTCCSTRGSGVLLSTGEMLACIMWDTPSRELGTF